MWSPAQTRVRPALSPAGRPHHPLPWPGFLLPGPSEWWKGKCGLKLGGPAWAPSPWGSPWDIWWTIVPTTIGQLCLRECCVSLLFCVMQHPGVIEKSAGVTCSCLKWGNIIAALTLLTRCWESVKHKWQGEQRKTEKEKWRVAWLLQVSPVIKSVYSLCMNPSSRTCQL